MGGESFVSGRGSASPETRQQCGACKELIDVMWAKQAPIMHTQPDWHTSIDKHLMKSTLC
jgi:hypothetical protein